MRDRGAGVRADAAFRGDAAGCAQKENQDVIESMRGEMKQRQAEFKEMMAVQRIAVKRSIDAKRADFAKAPCDYS